MSNSLINNPYSFLLKVIFIAFLPTFLYSCSATKRAVIKELKAEKSVDFLSTQLTESNFKFSWLSGKMEVDFEQNGKNQNFKSSFRIKNDSLIWISIYPALGIEVVRVSITPDTVQFIDKIHKQYFKGNYSYISQLLKTELNYKMIQALLLGNEYWIAEKEELFSSIDIETNSYLLSTIKKRKLRKLEKKDKEKADIAQGLWLNPDEFKVKELLINDVSNKRKLNVIYENFKKVSDQTIATKINAIIESVEDNYKITIELSKLKLDPVSNISFKIPDDYTPIK